ncbi:hypothetical protein CYY_008633 [Polysphondylium violaceum]|uniref:FNIP repeat-containing protein n=1 Tax=Polysphondylium violaceum TaxID=133409 RepID=A0A8J4UQ21_9MYCE|nr:hypothetical protein CYY_008633 [Polysphondylium violaceum]
MLDNDFFSIWRNLYLQSIIYFYRFQDQPLLIKKFSKSLKNSKYAYKDKVVLFNLNTRAPLRLIKEQNDSGQSNPITHFIIPCYMLSEFEKDQHDKLYGVKYIDSVLLHNEIPQNIKFLGLYMDTIPESEFTIPSSVTSMEVINSYVGGSFFPPNVKSLKYGFSKPGNLNCLPLGQLSQTLTRLELINIKGTIKPHYLPHSLTHLHMGNTYKTQLEPNVLPPNLTFLHMGGYDKEIGIDLIPSTVTRLEFGWEFDSYLPPGSLPSSLVTLIFNDRTVMAPAKFNQPLDQGLLPSTLKTLRLGSQFDQELNENVLPNSIIDFQCNKTVFIPPHTQVLKLTTIQPSLEIPHSVTNLDMGWINWNLQYGYFGNKLRVLSFKYAKQLVKGDIPSSVTKLTLHTRAALEPDVIPTSVIKLSLTSFIQQPIGHGIVPDSCQKLSLCLQYPTEQIEIPSSVKLFTFLKNSRVVLYPNMLPHGLVSLDLSNVLPTQSDSVSSWPSSLENLKISKTHKWIKFDCDLTTRKFSLDLPIPQLKTIDVVEENTIYHLNHSTLDYQKEIYRVDYY